MVTSRALRKKEREREIERERERETERARGERETEMHELWSKLQGHSISRCVGEPFAGDNLRAINQKGARQAKNCS